MKSTGLKVLLILFFSLFMLYIFVCTPELSGEETKKNTGEQKKSDFIFLPIIFYTPETKIALGLGGMYNIRASEDGLRSRPSSFRAAVIYTQKKQFIIEFGLDLYPKKEKFHMMGNFSFSKYSDRFYGIGNNTLEDMRENYTSRIARISLSVQKNVLSKLNFGIQYDFEYNKVIEVEESGELAKGEILGSEGGTASGIGLLINWDTRNNIFFPSSGDFYQLSAILFRSGLESDYNFTKYNLDLRKYFRLFSSHVLALQGYLNIITGDPPFQMLSLIGSQNWMRGYYRGRYRDKNMIAFQIEYRMPVWRRFGLVSFVGYGDVSDKLSNLELGNLKYSVGFGIRYLLSREEKINVRLDVGFGKESSGVYVAVSEAF